MGTCQDKEVVELFFSAASDNGYAFYCGRCGQVWGRLRTIGNRYFSPYTQSCKQHWTKLEEESLYQLSPGSMLAPLLHSNGEFFGDKGFPRLLDRMSDSHLRYEFNQALEWAEKEMKDG
jgi:hypothetical protein